MIKPESLPTVTITIFMGKVVRIDCGLLLSVI